MKPLPPDHTAPVNIQRRTKRRLWAPVHDLFAVTAPGLEPLCAAELAQLGVQNIQAQAGGVSFAGKLEDIYRANLWLRTAGRVLLRLADFRVRTWKDLQRQAARIPWEVLLAPDCRMLVSVSLKNSNLKHSGRVAQEVLAQAAEHMSALDLGPPRPATDACGAARVMLRAGDRRATISIDTSGEHLHKRGYRKAAGPAPLREDLAAGLLRLCQYQNGQALLDPMCGAGTLAIEACLMARGLPPGLRRDLALTAWPSHRQAMFANLRQRAAAAALSTTSAPVVARDRSAHTLRAAAANAARAGVEADLAIQKADFFEASPPETQPGLVVINPPYGKRLGSLRQAEDFHRRLGQRLRRAYRGWRVGVVLSRPAWAGLLGLHEIARRTVPHGGLKVTLLYGRVPG